MHVAYGCIDGSSARIGVRIESCLSFLLPCAMSELARDLQFPKFRGDRYRNAEEHQLVDLH